MWAFREVWGRNSVWIGMIKRVLPPLGGRRGQTVDVLLNSFIAGIFRRSCAKGKVGVRSETVLSSTMTVKVQQN